MLSGSFLTEMRRKALKVLKLNAAGTNPMLRLTISAHPQADPGLFQLFTVISTFLRMLHKSEEFYDQWCLHIEKIGHGRAPGPFLKFTSQLEMIGWSVVEPDWILDHRCTMHNVKFHDARLLRDRLFDAWLNFVSSQVKHKTMHDLIGIEKSLTFWVGTKTNSLERARISALQSGSFISDSQKAKFDGQKVPLCERCNVTDDRKHWLLCPEKQKFRHDFPPDWPTMIRDLPDCTTYHLLVPWQSELHLLDDYFDSIPEEADHFLSLQTVPGVQHLFLDGACTYSSNQLLSYAAWGVTHGSTKHVLAGAPLRGPRQSIDRAELMAVIGAVKWCLATGCPCILWSDSASTVRIAKQVIKTMALEDINCNLDLWNDFLMLVTGMPAGHMEINWIPSHLDLAKMDDHFEEWVATCNGQVDQVAVLVNHQRSQGFWQLHRRIELAWNRWIEVPSWLRRFYLNVANSTGAKLTKGPAGQLASVRFVEDDFESAISLHEHLPTDWRSRILPEYSKFPGFFMQNVIEQIAAWDLPGASMQMLTDIELCVALARSKDFCFPFWNQDRKRWSPRTYEAHFERPLLSRLVGVLSPCVDEMVGLFGVESFRTHGVSCAPYGITKLGKGLYIMMPSDVRDDLIRYMCRFTARRAVRTAADLSRPLN